MRKYDTRNCECCGVEFTPQHRSDQKHCSYRCGQTYYANKKAREKLLEAEKVIHICQHCQTEFATNKDRTRKWCSNHCKQENYKAEKRLVNEEKHKLNPKRCKGCNKEFILYRTDQIWCSSQCKMNIHATDQKETRAATRAQITRTCPVCDEEFSPKRSMREKYCSSRCRNLFAKKAYKVLQRCLKCTDQKKQDRAHKLLGYTPQELRDHIQKHPNWENVKGSIWHLDHIFPIIAFLEHGLKDISLMCCLENLQPLGGSPNCSKGGKYNRKKFREWLINKGVHIAD